MIGSILNGKKGLIAVTSETPIRAIVALLHEHRIGAVLVLDGDAIMGMVSERDICRCLHDRGDSILQAAASDIMTAPVITGHPAMSVAEAMEVMTDRRFRHLPVIEGGRCVGIVSIGDLVKRRIEEAEHEAAAMKAYIAS